MQLRPDLRTGTEHQQPHRFSAIAQGQDKQPRTPIFTRTVVTHHRTCAIVNLRLFAEPCLDASACFRCRRSPQLSDETLDTLVAASEAVDVHQILPNRLGVTAPGEPQFDGLSVSLTGTRRTIAVGLRRGCYRHGGHRQLCARVGGHLVGRFCRWSLSPNARWSQVDAGSSQIILRRGPVNPGSLLDLAQGPSQPSQGYNLLLLFFAQNIAHVDRGYWPPRQDQRPE